MLADLHTEIINYLTEKLPGVTVEAYTPEFLSRRSTPLPGCLIELPAFDPELDFGNRRDISKVLLNLEARLIVDPNRQNSVYEIETFAAIVWWALRDWVSETPKIGPIRMKHAGEDVFKPDPRGYLAWLVEWEHEAYLDFSDEEILPLLKKLTAQDDFGNIMEVESK